MTVAAKICGIAHDEALHAAIAGGARFVGFVFYPPSPRNLTLERAAALAAQVPAGITRVAVAVDPQDDFLARLFVKVPVDLLQLHGTETPARVQAIKDRFRVPAMKAIPIGTAQDLAAAAPYFGVADWLMFDAKPPKDKSGALPGGNAVVFDWRLLSARRWPLPWMLSGGLDPGNLAAAVRLARAEAVDVSSGVERAPGVKDVAKIRLFLACAAAL